MSTYSGRERRSNGGRADLALIACWFLASRAVYWRLGVRPDPTAPAWLWQVLPLQDLADRPLESLWFLHSQPPLYNAIVALCLQLPGAAATWLHATWIAVGYGLVAVLFKWFRLAGLPRWLSHVAVVAFAMNPSLVLYENFLFYTYLEAFCLLGAMYGLAAIDPRAADAPKRLRTYVVFASGLVGLRAIFQPVWPAAVAGAAWWTMRRTRTAGVAAALLVPVLFAVALQVKNGLMFGVWSSSTWYGMNIGKLPRVALDEKVPDLYARGVVSRIFVVGIFGSISQYPGEIVNPEIVAASRRFGRVSVLLREWKAEGSPNFNGAGHIAVSRQMAKDAWAAFRAEPYPVLRLAAEGFRRFFLPTSQLLFLDANRARLERLERFYTRILYPLGWPVIPMAALLLTLLSAAAALRRPPRDMAWIRTPAAYVLLTVAWVLVVSNVGDFGENNRYRFPIDATIYAWLGMVAWNFRALWRAPDVRLAS